MMTLRSACCPPLSRVPSGGGGRCGFPDQSRVFGLPRQAWTAARMVAARYLMSGSSRVVGRAIDDVVSASPMESRMSRLRVRLAPPSAVEYEVVVEPDSLQRLGELVARVAPAARYAVISDQTVAGLYGDPVCTALAGTGSAVRLFDFPAGEQYKTRASWADLTDALLAAEVGRDAGIVALGGGVTGDLAGFVASTYMRGIPFVQVPTTLLAMIDASIGGKTGVNTVHGKNLVGAFLQPRLVLADPRVLTTLPVAELRSGLAEAVKHGALADAAYLHWIGAQARPLLDRDPMVLARLVARSVEIKASVVARDPLERGQRACLNFGHTLGHALERVTNYGMPHGFAVAVGMCLEAQLGEALALTEPGTAAMLVEVLTALGLPVAPPPGVTARELLAATRTDKKARASRVRYALLRRPGAAFVPTDGSWTVSPDPAVVAKIPGLAGHAGAP